MTRASRVAKSFIADEAFSREVQDMAQAVAGANASYVSVTPILVALADHGRLECGALAAHPGVVDEELVAALRRLQDLGMVTVSTAGDDQMVTLTPEGSVAAARQRAA